MQLVHTEQLFAQRNVAVHRRERAVHRVDQVVVDRRRYFGAVQRSVQRGRIAAGIGKKQQLLHLCGQGSRRGIAELTVYRIKRIERGTAQHAVVGLHQRDKGTVRHRMRYTVSVHRIRESKVGIVQHGIDLIRCGGHFPGGSQQRLFLI